jgi:dethiobiotin synthetase
VAERLTHIVQRGVFVTSTGTSSGKTFVARALTRALVLAGKRVAALKPIETGCVPFPQDALALAAAAGNSSLAYAAAWYRAAPPLAPYAVTLATGEPAPAFEAIVAHTKAFESAYDRVVVEGAGGLLVPLDRERSMADLARAIGYPLLLVASDELGVLSHVFTSCEAARSRELPLTAVILTRVAAESDPSRASNCQILRERLDLPVLQFPHVPDDDSALASAAVSCGLLAALSW